MNLNTHESIAKGCYLVYFHNCRVFVFVSVVGFIFAQK